MFGTRFTEAVGCRYPIQQAGMGTSATAALAAAVSNAGGLGMLGGIMLPRERVFAEIAEVRRLTDRPFGINFVSEFLDRSIVEPVARRCRVVEFFYGEPDADLVERVHSGGALAAWQVGSMAEGMRAVEAGCDVVIVQGVEAGGHVRGTTGLLTLLEELRERTDAVLVAAGGIGSGRKIVAAMVMGADAVRVGTRFLAAEESNAHDEYKAALVAADAEGTVLSRTFCNGWDNPHRALRSAIDAAGRLRAEDTVGEIEIAGVVQPVGRFNSHTPTKSSVGNIAAMALFAGESVGRVTAVSPASQIMAELVGEVDTTVRSLQSRGIVAR